MRETLPIVSLERQGETAWSLSGPHTGLTDLRLTDSGESDDQDTLLSVMRFECGGHHEQAAGK